MGEATVVPLSYEVGDIDNPSIVGDGIPIEYETIVNRIKETYSSLPILDYDELYKELAELSVKSCPTPTLQVLNVEIQKVQGAKDRLSEIFVNVLRTYTFKKRAVDILRDSWAKYANDKSADKRKADAISKTSLFEIDFGRTESMLKVCTHILRNLDSLHDSLSRRITVMQLQLKLHDIGRGALPDFDFDKGDKDEDVFETIVGNGKSPVDSSKGIEAKEETF
jgi:hypothetical protein